MDVLDDSDTTEILVVFFCAVSCSPCGPELVRVLNMKESGLNLFRLCFSSSAPYVHGHATAARGGEGGWQHYSDLHCLRKPQAGGHLAERGGSADQQQEIHGNI